MSACGQFNTGLRMTAEKIRWFAGTTKETYESIND